MKKLAIIPAIALMTMTASFAQEGINDSDVGYNSNSVRPTHNSDIMWRKRVVRALDMREKQNEPLFSKNKELSRLLIEAVKDGKLRPYASDSLENGQIMTLEEFTKKLIIPGTEVTVDDPDWTTDTEPIDDGTEDLWPEMDEDIEDNEDIEDDFLDEGAATGPEEYGAHDLYQFEITEDMIFDKQKSQMKYDVQSITLYIPADHPLNIRGIQDPVATFSYKDVVKILNNDPRAIWYNPYNDAEHKSFADAIELRLFSSYMIKVSNPSDDYIVDQYGGDQWTGILASQWKEYELLEFEHNLWEF